MIPYNNLYFSVKVSLGINYIHGNGALRFILISRGFTPTFAISQFIFTWRGKNSLYPVIQHINWVLLQRQKNIYPMNNLPLAWTSTRQNKFLISTVNTASSIFPLRRKENFNVSSYIASWRLPEALWDSSSFILETFFVSYYFVP